MQLESESLDPFNLALGQRLRKARNERGLTREKLAEKLQLVSEHPFFEHPTNLRRVENAEISLKLKHLIVLAQVLQVDKRSGSLFFVTIR